MFFTLTSSTAFARPYYSLRICNRLSLPVRVAVAETVEDAHQGRHDVVHGWTIVSQNGCESTGMHPAKIHLRVEVMTGENMVPVEPFFVKLETPRFKHCLNSTADFDFSREEANCSAELFFDYPLDSQPDLWEIRQIPDTATKL